MTGFLAWLVLRLLSSPLSSSPLPVPPPEDMRKPLSRDESARQSIQLPQGVNDGRQVRVRPEDVYF